MEEKEYQYEYGFISCLLNKPELAEEYISKIKPEYLVNNKCKIIYETIIELGTCDIPLLIKNNLPFKEIILIKNLISSVTKSTINSYAYVILETFKQRKMKEVIENNKFKDVSEELREISKLSIFEERPINESEEFLKNLEQINSKLGDNRNIETGFYSIDSQIKGFRKSEAIFIGGRPASGKTTLGMNIAFNMAKKRKRILFCSIEMGAVELHERLVKSITKFNDYENMGVSDFNKTIEVSRRVKEELPLFIYDKAGMTLEDIFFKARKEKEENGLDAVFVDHLSILKSIKSFRSRYEELSYITARIKVLARELDIPVICLCQLNRNLESRDIKAPNMSDIRDSGTVEQDGDIIAFVYRPEYHLKDKEPDNKNSREYIEWEQQMLELKGKAQFIIAKNRRGLTPRIKLMFDGENFTFYERDC